MDSYALLADATTGRRTSVLKTDDEAFSVRAWGIPSDERALLLLSVWLDGKYAQVLLTDDASILATTTDSVQNDAEEWIALEAQRKGVRIADGDRYSLLADSVDAARRTSVLRGDGESWSLRAKRMLTDDDATYVQLRIEAERVGFIHLLLDEDGAIVAFVTGGTDADAWSRLRGELGRRDIELD